MGELRASLKILAPQPANTHSAQCAQLDTVEADRVVKTMHFVYLLVTT